MHIIDPFTGTGTFITRLLQSGLISKEQLAHKYQHEIHANEIVLLAYYIAAINIEAVYHDIMGGDYVPFDGICLTDTFQLHEKEDLVSNMLEANSSRRKKQKALDIRVIIGNPPYSAGQTSANDNNANIAYPLLDESIRGSYAAKSKAVNKNALYDSYIRAIRWASNRIGNSGVIGYVSNAGFVDANTADGLRQCLAEEFSSIYIFHLRGNARTSGELRRQEKDNVFGQGTRTPIAISILVKNPNAAEHGKIVMHDIGDYLSREEKLARIVAFKSIHGIAKANGWQPINPDKHGDWVGQRDDSFTQFMSLGDKKDKDAVTVFENYSSGLQPRGDAWFYNLSKIKLAENIQKSINFFNSEVDRFKASYDKSQKLESFVKRSTTQFAWYGDNIKDVAKGSYYSYRSNSVVTACYRPYTKCWVHFDINLMHRIGKLPHIFPNAEAKNQVISVTGRGATKEFSALMTDTLPDLEMISKGQCFPEYTYEAGEPIDSTAQHSTAQHSTAQHSTAQHSTAQHSTIIPRLSEEQEQNLVICLSVGATKSFSVLMTNTIPDLHLIGDSQCFPMFLYETVEGK